MIAAAGGRTLIRCRRLREQARPHLSGYPGAGIELCTRRLTLESLLADLEERSVAAPESSETKVIPMRLRTFASALSGERAA